MITVFRTADDSASKVLNGLQFSNILLIIKIIITIVHISQETLIKECFVQSPVGDVDLPFLTFL